MEALQTEVTEVQKQLLKKALTMLNATGVKYALVDFDNVKHGTLEIAPEKIAGKRAPSITPHGSVLEYALPYIKDMLPGEVTQIPTTEMFTAKRLQSTITGWVFRSWGEGAATTHQNHKNNTLEVLRIA
jgi:hypothetical protein